MGLNKDQRNLLENFRLPTDFSNLADGDACLIDDVVCDELQLRALNDSGDGLNDYGKLCLSILDELGEAD